MDAGVGFEADDVFPEADTSSGDFLDANELFGDLVDFEAADFDAVTKGFVVETDFDFVGAALESLEAAFLIDFAGSLAFAGSDVLAELAFTDFAFAGNSSAEIFPTLFDGAAI